MSFTTLVFTSESQAKLIFDALIEATATWSRWHDFRADEARQLAISIARINPQFLNESKVEAREAIPPKQPAIQTVTRAKCPTCDKRIALTSKGKIRAHQASVWSNHLGREVLRRCLGSGKKVL